jgi:ferrous iron transport protein B
MSTATAAQSVVATPTDGPVFAIIGNPNSGKTTLFNALTGLRQKVGNYPGVTVEKKVGVCYSQHGRPMKVIDLPGAYSLAARSPDEAVLRDVLLGRRTDTARPDRVVCVVDASNLERNLYLVSQVCDLGLPVIIALNMTDLAEEAGIDVNAVELERLIGVPVIRCQASTGKGVLALRLAMSRSELPRPAFEWKIPEKIVPAVNEVIHGLTAREGRDRIGAQAEALTLLSDRENFPLVGSSAPSGIALDVVNRHEERWRKEGYDWRGALVAARYEAIGLVLERVQRNKPRIGVAMSDRIDAVAVHPALGWFVLGAVMTGLFLSIFSFAEYPMNWIDAGVAMLGDAVRAQMAPGDLRDLITDGVIAGVGGVIIFLPQILILFFFIGLLESTGYMARAAFIMDRLMSHVGLSGKAFIPLLSSYACAIPGIMATRTIEDRKDRLVTILVAPLMSCSARLPVYILMIAALVPGERVPLFTKVGIMLLMYALGTIGAFLFAWLFKRVLLRGETPLMILELPPYRVPSLRAVAMHMFERAFLFLKRAGTVILGISIILWFLTAYPKHENPEATAAAQIEGSFAGSAGKLIEPAIEPLGFDWQIGIGLIASFAAREVFVSSMAVVFSAGDDADETSSTLRQALLDAKCPDGRQLFTPLVCFTLMVFYVFAMQCISTIVIVRRETNSWTWPLFQVGYMTGTAWFASFIVYQAGRALGFS